MSEFYEQNKKLIHILFVVAFISLFIICLGCFSFFELFVNPKFVSAKPIPKATPKVKVIVAKESIEAFNGIIEEDISQREIAENELPPLAVTNYAEAMHTIPIKTFAKNEILRTHMLKEAQISSEFVTLGRRYLKSAHPEKAPEMLNKAILANPDSAAAHEWLGHAYWKLEEPQKAKACFQDAIALDPHSEYSYSYLAYICLKENRYKETIEYSDKALSLAPEESNVLAYKGVAQFFLDNNKQAIENLNKSLALDKEYGYAFYYRARAHLALKNYKQALEDIDQAIKFKYWDKGSSLRVKANILSKAGKPDQALKYFDESLNLKPNPNTFIDRASCCVKLNKLTEAWIDVEKAFCMTNNPPPCYFEERAKINYLLKKYDLAQEDLNQVLTANQSSPIPDTVYVMIANIMVKRGKAKPALAYLDNCLESNKRSGCLYFERGLLNQSLGNQTGAESDFAQARSLNYNSAENNWIH